MRALRSDLVFMGALQASSRLLKRAGARALHFRETERPINLPQGLFSQKTLYWSCSPASTEKYNVSFSTSDGYRFRAETMDPPKILLAQLNYRSLLLDGKKVLMTYASPNEFDRVNGNKTQPLFYESQDGAGRAVEDVLADEVVSFAREAGFDKIIYANIELGYRLFRLKGWGHMLNAGLRWIAPDNSPKAIREKFDRLNALAAQRYEKPGNVSDIVKLLADPDIKHPPLTLELNASA